MKERSSPDSDSIAAMKSSMVAAVPSFSFRYRLTPAMKVSRPIRVAMSRTSSAPFS